MWKLAPRPEKGIVQGCKQLQNPKTGSKSWSQNQRSLLISTVYLLSYLCLWALLAVLVQSLSCVQLFATPWTAACQGFLSFTISRSLLKLMSIGSMMPSNHLILCLPLLLLPSIFPSTRVFFSESALCHQVAKVLEFQFSISLSNEYSGLISFRISF